MIQMTLLSSSSGCSIPKRSHCCTLKTETEPCLTPAATTLQTTVPKPTCRCDNSIRRKSLLWSRFTMIFVLRFSTTVKNGARSHLFNCSGSPSLFTGKQTVRRANNGHALFSIPRSVLKSTMTRWADHGARDEKTEICKGFWWKNVK